MPFRGEARCFSAEKLARTCPDTRRVTTYDAEENAPMVAVDRALGHQPAGHLSTWSTRLTGGGGRAG